MRDGTARSAAWSRRWATRCWRCSGLDSDRCAWAGSSPAGGGCFQRARSRHCAVRPRATPSDHRPMIIAIDGGVASGKSAVGRRVAEKVGLPFIDSGLMYRAITRLAASSGIDPRDSDAVTRLADSHRVRVEGERVWADGTELTEGIYDTDYADALPIVSAIPGVREALVAQQRNMGESGVVMAGRDIGTVVFPGADHKFFLVASLDEKVRRRAAQYERRGERVDEETMRKEVEQRDRVDSERPVAPLRPAHDAVIIDTDNLELDEVVERILKEIRAHA